MSATANDDAAADKGAVCEPEVLRLALRRLAGGVTVVATCDASGVPRGMVMTAVMPLSFQPPSMLIAVNRFASLLAPLLERGVFSIGVVCAEHHGWCHGFACGSSDERFVSSDWTTHELGVPVCRKAIATIICDASFKPEAGGLIYLDGRYASARFASGGTR